ncbi:hypothetical protein [Rhodococcus erythropolis]
MNANPPGHPIRTDPHGQPIRIDLVDPRQSIRIDHVDPKLPATPPRISHAVCVECVVCARRSESLPVSLKTGVCTRCEPVAQATYIHVKKEDH